MRTTRCRNENFSEIGENLVLPDTLLLLNLDNTFTECLEEPPQSCCRLTCSTCLCTDPLLRDANLVPAVALLDCAQRVKHVWLEN
jgi:hypothetical protein